MNASGSKGPNLWKWMVITAIIFAPAPTFMLAEYLSKGGISFGFNMFGLVGEERQKSMKETEGWLK